MNEITAVDQIGFPILSTMIVLPLVLLVIVGLLRDQRSMRPVALAGALIELAGSLLLVARFKRGEAGFQFSERVPWIDELGVNYHLAVDGISVLFLPLTAFLLVVVMLTSWAAVRQRPRGYLMMILAFESAAIGVFCSVDLIVFFVFWELVLIPTYVLMRIWGSGPNRARTARRYVLNMLTGSACLLAGFILLALNHRDSTGTLSFDLLILMQQDLPAGRETLVFFLLAFAFALKAPLFPFHSWMPSALLDGPIGMAVFLSGLKFGVFGFLRFVMPLTPDAFVTWRWLVAGFGLASILFGALVALAEPNMRRLQAFASVSHVGLAMVGLASLTTQGVQGALFLILSLGVTSTGMLLAAGFVHQRMGSTDIASLGGLAQRAPVLALFAFVAGLSAIALPGTIGFPGEFLVLVGAFEASGWMAAGAVVTVVVSAAYVLVYYQRAFNGPVANPMVEAVADLRPTEAIAGFAVGALILAFGFFPGAMLEFTKVSVDVVVERLAQPDARAEPVKG